LQSLLKIAPISLFEEATERTPSKDGEAGWMVCSVCAELEEEPYPSEHQIDLRKSCGSALADQNFVR
jgi:hypothetical protein